MRILIATAVILAAASPASAATLFSAAGSGPAAIQGAVDSFRAALGANNGNVAGAQGAGRREINWDGGGAAAPAATFANPMETFAFRGNVYTTPGSGFEISGQPSAEFGDINAQYPSIFQPFSGARLFAPLGSNVTDVAFNVPGSAGAAARTRGFGVVFADVDLAGPTSIEFFNGAGASLGSYSAAAADNGLTFLGVLFDGEVVARARITTGNTPLGVADGGSVDVVVMDDFIFAEPVAVPEPSAWALMILGFGAAGCLLRRRGPLAAVA
jgi:hypothetical protein